MRLIHRPQVHKQMQREQARMNSLAADTTTVEATE